MNKIDTTFIPETQNDADETVMRPLVAAELSNIEGGGIIDAAKELIRLLRTAGEPQL